MHFVSQRLMNFLNDYNLGSYAEVKMEAGKLFATNFINYDPIPGTTKDFDGFVYALLGFKTDLKKNKMIIKSSEEVVDNYRSYLLIASRTELYKENGDHVPETEKVGVLHVTQDGLIEGRHIFSHTITLHFALEHVKTQLISNKH